MNKIKSVWLLVPLLLLAAPSTLANRCGFQPFPPIGCSSSGATCQCDSAGHCHWVFNCDDGSSGGSTELKTFDFGKARSDAADIRRRELENQRLEQELRQQETGNGGLISQTEGLSADQVIEMARILCTADYITEEQREETCRHYRQLEASRREGDRIWQEACAQSPTLQGCHQDP